MHNYYQDILALTDLKPTWFDENAVPRFCEFTPSAVANIYANEVALVLIQCQGCQTPFHVAFSISTMDECMGTTRISARIQDGSLRYGDPPNVECCAAGPTMNSEPVRVLEFWRRTRGHEIPWERDLALEGVREWGWG